MARPNGRVLVTVLGEVPVENMGFTLPHEHLTFDLSHFYREPKDPWQRQLGSGPVRLENVGELRRAPVISSDNLVLTDVDVAAAEVELFSAAGGRTIVDMSPPALGRSPAALREIALRTGVHIVASTGFYIQPTHPSWVATASVDDVTAYMLDEIQMGIDGSGVRAGAVGEIGLSPGPLHPDEAKVLRAAAQVQQETGVAVSIHNPVPHGKNGVRVVSLLAATGADPTKVIMGHMTHTVPDVDYHRSVADSGAYIEFDRFGGELFDESTQHQEPSDIDVVREIAELVKLGYADRILLSHDAGFKIQLATYGGLGLRHVPTRIVRLLQACGLSGGDVEQMTIQNPRDVFGVAR